MSLSSIINIASSGLLAQQTAIAATSENVTNATTPGFEPRVVSFETAPVAGRFSGVSAEVTRAGADRFLQSASFESVSRRASTDARAGALARISDSLGTLDDASSFAARSETAISALAALGNDPSSPVLAGDAIAALNRAFDAFATTQSAITAEIDRAGTLLASYIEEANGLLAEIDRLNRQIGASGGETASADVLTARLGDLSELAAISVRRDDLGRATVTLETGQTLVTETGFSAFSLAPGSPPDLLLAGQGPLALTGGRIGGSLRLLTEDLPQLAAQVDQVASDFAAALNRAAGENTGSPPATAITGTTNLDAAAFADLTGTATFAVLDGAGQLLRRVDVDFDAGTLAVNANPPVAFAPSVSGFEAALQSALGPGGTVSLTVSPATISVPSGQGLVLSDDSAGLGAAIGRTPVIERADSRFRVRSDIADGSAGFPVFAVDLSGAAPGGTVLGQGAGAGIARLVEAARAERPGQTDLIGSIGGQASRARDEATTAQSFAESIEQRLASEGGVNLEEELANLILFQRSFNANARLLSVADDLYQSVLALI